MSGELETHHMLALSMDHITQKTCEMMEAKFGHIPTVYMDLSVLPVFYDKPMVGWFIPVRDPHELPERCPDDLVHIIRFAHELGFSWIMLDNDVEAISDLPSYDW